MYAPTEYEFGTLSRNWAGVMGVCLTADHINGERKIRFCENRSEVAFYEKILSEWLSGFDREESDYIVNQWGVNHKSEFPLMY